MISRKFQTDQDGVLGGGLQRAVETRIEFHQFGGHGLELVRHAQAGYLADPAMIEALFWGSHWPDATDGHSPRRAARQAHPAGVQAKFLGAFAKLELVISGWQLDLLLALRVDDRHL